MRDRFQSTIELPGYTGANNDNTAVQNYLIARPNTVTTIQATNEVPTSGGFINTTPAGSACTQPTF